MRFLSLLNCFGSKNSDCSDHSSLRKRSRQLTHDDFSSGSTPHTGNSEGKNFQIINGRRFNNEEDVGYLLPNDDPESDRLHFQHWAMKYTFGGNYHAPLHRALAKGIKVVDAGCGPATWTFEMAKDYPNSKFTGIDVSFVFPEAIMPPNVDLQICNIAKELPFEDNSIDYYFQRLLVAGLTRSEMNTALQNAYRILKPGGYIELVEVNMGYCENSGPVMAKSQADSAAMMEGRGMIPNMGDHVHELLEEAGFENIQYEKKTVPVNHTNKAGELWWENLAGIARGLRSMVAKMNPAFEDPEVHEEFIRTMGQECVQNKTNVILGIAFAQKPADKRQ
ncbi:S-adenosyl-L-methionine-dependent methyltransferase [Pilobolus umbonatus]|nr:S-adenosyl-L-methionine-dependent methyltransferase [Pilobolus umbonatus]